MKATEWIMCDSPALSTLRIKRKEVEKVEAERISHEVVRELHCEWVVMTVDSDVRNWEEISKELQRCLKSNTT